MVFLHTLLMGKSPLTEQTSSEKVPSPFGPCGAGGTGIGTGVGVAAGVGVVAGLDTFTNWLTGFFCSGCFFAAGPVSDFLSSFLAATIFSLAGLSFLSLSDFAVRSPLTLPLFFRSVTVRGLVATCGALAGLGFGSDRVRGDGDGAGFVVVLGGKTVSVIEVVSKGIGLGVAVALGVGLIVGSVVGLGVDGCGVDFAEAGDPKPKNSFSLAVNDRFGIGVGVAPGRGLTFCASGGSGIIPESMPPVSALIRSSFGGLEVWG